MKKVVFNPVGHYPDRGALTYTLHCTVELNGQTAGHMKKTTTLKARGHDPRARWSWTAIGSNLTSMLSTNLRESKNAVHNHLAYGEAVS